MTISLRLSRWGSHTHRSPRAPGSRNPTETPANVDTLGIARIRVCVDLGIVHHKKVLFLQSLLVSVIRIVL
jgi:hypothetical protein